MKYEDILLTPEPGLDEPTKAYLAGIMDGEGCIGIYETISLDLYSSAILQVTVGMTVPDAVDLIAKTYGVCSFWIFRKNVKPQKRVTLRSEKALRLLKDIMYVSPPVSPVTFRLV